MAGTRRPARVVEVGEGQSATTLELFFDLVFVFALTQVTAMMAHEASASAVLQGLLVVGIVWWCWVCYSWLGNLVQADEGLARVAMLCGMAGMFVIALTIPEAFHDFARGLDGPTVFALGYLVVRAVHILLFTLASQGDPELRHRLLFFGGTTFGSTVLLLIAAGFDGRTETMLWAGVLLVDYGGTLMLGSKGWRIRSPRHFAERHGLIVIVALGESIVAIGVGVALEPISWPVIAASVLGLAVSGSLWWAYFDVLALQAERNLSHVDDRGRVAMAQHAYTYLHLPLVAGVVLLALGLKKVMSYVADTEHHDLTDALGAVPTTALLGGVVMFLVAHAAFAVRTGCGVPWPRLVAAVVLVALLALGHDLPALAVLGLAAVVLVALNAWDTVRDLEARAEIRHAHH